MRRFHQSRFGFSLLEVIVALLLLSSTGVALFAWINQSLASTGRLQQRLEDVRVLQQSEALMSDVNPAIAAEGELQDFGLRHHWIAEPTGPELPARAFGDLNEPGASSAGPRWYVRLFRVRVEVEVLRSGARYTYELLKLGRQWR